MTNINKQTISSIFKLPVEYLFPKENIKLSRKQYSTINKIYKEPIKKFITNLEKRIKIND